MIAGMTPSLSPVPMAWVTADLPALAADDPRLFAIIREDEGLTLILPATDASALGLTTTFLAAQITLTVHSALDGVGLTAAVAVALADRGIPCNVVAGAWHDHLFVPWDRRNEALAALVARQTDA
jgi:uncharacterized protein